jgi:hypothetical protein
MLGTHPAMAGSPEERAILASRQKPKLTVRPRLTPACDHVSKGVLPWGEAVRKPSRPKWPGN